MNTIEIAKQNFLMKEQNLSEYATKSTESIRFSELIDDIRPSFFRDIDRIIRMQLAPINISIQTTNPELRCKMLYNRFAGEKLKFLDKF